jgi:peptidoglycan hydrolase-like protein with peptidoglycan-binding domain
MVLRRAIRLGLSLVIAAGFGVCAGIATPMAAAQSTAAKRPSGSSSSTNSGTGGKTRKTSKKSKKKDRGQQAPASDRITEIQQALSKDGSYNGTPSGKWDDATVSAMKKFQSDHGLNPSGKLEARSLERLGLGSQTAGVGAPIIPPNSSSRLSSAAAQPERE